MTSTNIDYVDTYFENPTLTKIHGEPTYDALKTMEDELKTNATGVTSDLGGGGHGHLGLVLNPIRYALISPVPYVRPVHPGPLVIPPGTTQHESTRLRNEHKELIKLYRETVDVEKSMIKQVVATIDSKYLKPLRNADSNSINVPLHDVLDFLFARYGKVTGDTLDDFEEKVKNMSYHPSEPLVTVFNQIEDLERLGVAARDPFTDKQLVKIGLKIIKNTRDFADGLKTWYQRPRVEHTYANFKTHFEDALELLREIRGSDMTSEVYQQANAVAEVLRDELEKKQDQFLNTLREEIRVANEKEQVAKEQAQTQHEANAATSKEDLILQALKDISNQLKVNNEKQPSRFRANSRRTHYCWSHGKCGHPSNQCRAKKEGHKDDATMTNKMGGSTKGCNPQE